MHMKDRNGRRVFVFPVTIGGGSNQTIIHRKRELHADCVKNRITVAAKATNGQGGEHEMRRPFEITTMPYPGFPTDMQAQMCALMSVTPGISVVTEKIFPNRFMHISEMARLGADCFLEGGTTMEIATRAMVETLTRKDFAARDLLWTAYRQEALRNRAVLHLLRSLYRQPRLSKYGSRWGDILRILTDTDDNEHQSIPSDYWATNSYARVLIDRFHSFMVDKAHLYPPHNDSQLGDLSSAFGFAWNALATAGLTAKVIEAAASSIWRI